MAKPQPTALLELKGSFKTHPERRRPHEPVIEAALGNPPAHFTLEQQKAWLDLTSWAPPGVFTAADRTAVEVAAKLLVELREMPLISAKPAAIARMQGFFATFGMTPSDRSRIAVPKPTEADPWAELAAKGGSTNASH